MNKKNQKWTKTFATRKEEKTCTWSPQFAVGVSNLPGSSPAPPRLELAPCCCSPALVSSLSGLGARRGPSSPAGLGRRSTRQPHAWRDRSCSSQRGERRANEKGKTVTVQQGARLPRPLRPLCWRGERERHEIGEGGDMVEVAVPQ